MSKVLVIGAGGVSSVCVHKMAMNAGIFSEIHLASRTRTKCDAIAASADALARIDVAAALAERAVCKCSAPANNMP